ncbi:ABC transporter substrate-binding protein [Halorussus salinisoli]|uniref:ABC transporter substrate-binding protein n=1 Tax=Halorussus salinisoli TaxID=2558242 RepID=UPI0010C179E3|nr:ABC transporter substrate-binding protein [Halorussus salinisoli]
MSRNGTEVRRRRFLRLAGGASAVGLAGLGSARQEDVLLGHLAPFSGGLGWIGPNARNGIAVALSEINEAGLLDGRQVSLNRQDSETNPQAALSGFQTLDSQGVVAIIGPSSTVMPNLVQPAQNAQLPLISTMAGTLQLDDVGGEYIWRTVPSDSIGGRAQGAYATEQGWQRMALTFKNDKGSQSFSAAVGEFFQSQGGEVVGETPLAPNADSYRSEINSIQDSDPDVISMTAATEVTSLFIQNFRELGVEIPLLLSNDVITPDFIDQMGAETMEGMLGQAPAPGPAFDQFASKYEEAHGERPGTFSDSSYDAMNLIALAIQKAGEASRQAVAQNLRSVGGPPGQKVTTFPEGKQALENGNEIDYQGAANPQNFDENGNVVGPFSVVRVENGEWTEIQTFSASELTQGGGTTTTSS